MQKHMYDKESGEPITVLGKNVTDGRYTCLVGEHLPGTASAYEESIRLGSTRVRWYPENELTETKPGKKIELNEDYVAEVRKDGSIKVGCQIIGKATIRKVWEAVKALG